MSTLSPPPRLMPIPGLLTARGWWWLRLATTALLLGRAWQHFRHLTPWQALSGENWVAFALGGMFLLGAGLCWGKWPEKLRVGGLVACGVALWLYFLVDWSQKDWVPEQLIEHATQALLPFLVIGAGWRVWPEKKWTQLALLAVSLTFLGHGLFALGAFHPVPSHFLGMTQRILGVEEASARLFLQIAGTLDLLVVLGIWGKKTRQIALAYAVFWGLATALARMWAHLDLEALWPTLDRWAFETVMRLGHGLLPLALLLDARFNHKGH